MNNKNLVRAPKQPFLLMQDRHIPIEVRRHRRARRINLRYDVHSHSIRLTLPWRASVKEGLRFVEEKRDWLARQIEERPARARLAEGDGITVLGQSLTLHYTHAPRGRVEIHDGVLHIPGSPEFQERRLKDWLKASARREIAARAVAHAARMGKSLFKVSVRDTRSRWGSCSSDGKLNFSWRLILAPPPVMEYVICHEVAHLIVMNHSQRFWKIVAELCPHHEASRAWLRKNGEALHCQLT